MGFIKRFLSMGSRKSKKRQQNHNPEPMPVDAQGRLKAAEPWQDETTRLLRSSSAHFTVVSEVDYTSLPPLPHPVNTVCLNTPVTTPARSTTSAIKRSGTYTVTVHGRTTHSRTEFPNANPPLLDEPKEDAPHADLHFYDESPTKPKSHPNPRSVPFTPRDQGRLLRLRQDPSVASLLYMYDDKGRIQSTAFSNTPPNATPVYEVEGREQKKRTGSTLRQLMGEMAPGLVADCTAMEGDISWAERELARIDRTSMASESSLPLETPKGTHFDHPEPHVVTNATFASDDSNLDSSANWPVISSLEVELSGTTSIDFDHHSVLNEVTSSEYQDMDSKTPQRASEVFGFLTDRRKSILERKRAQAEVLAPLPALALPGLEPPTRSLSTYSSATSTPALTTSTTTNSLNSSPTASSETSSAQIHHATLTKLTPMSRSTDTLNILYTPSAGKGLPAIPASTPTAAQLSKIPRGPRPAPVATSSKHTPSASQTSLSRLDIAEPAFIPSRIPKTNPRPHDPYTPVHTRPHRRTASRTSSTMVFDDDDDDDMKVATAPKDNRSRRPAEVVDKENSPQDPRPRTYPKTPGVRSYSHSRALFDARHPNLVNGDPPSPASSTELSPITREIMSDLRKKKTHAQTRIPSGRSGKHVL
ncbi:hypothetical protein EUX98_g1657 [Antrodiella citrinella]|uniref:Uncharacterized protein n=1 Tax=Antrodiella citrinella TaxID=2447956 RepID=A0A4S4N2D1_9APHY|nr:hypothetical protein EUX98_g1657 [Antrodiella citrinella]